MKKKQMIQIVVIIVCFGIAGLVLYNGFFNKPAPTSVPALMQPSSPYKSYVAAPGGSSTSSVITTGQSDSGSILPYGTDLNFDILSQQDFQQQGYQNPKVDLKSQVGISEQNLITAATSTSQKLGTP